MAKRRNLSNKKSRPAQKNSIRLLSIINISYIQLTLGLLFGMILGAFIACLGFNSIQNNTENLSTINSEVSQKTAYVHPASIPTATITKNIVNEQPKAFKYTVQKGDNFAKLGKKFCNNSTAYLHLMDINSQAVENGLHAGDTITISCQ